MTDEQIVKALECCIQVDWDVCTVCPLYDREEGCLSGDLRKDALDLIQRQQAEIERLKSMDVQVEVSKRLEKEIKNEAIKEFAEKLKETNLYEFIEEYFDDAELCYEVRNDLFNDFVDNIVIEMTEEGK